MLKGQYPLLSSHLSVVSTILDLCNGKCEGSFCASRSKNWVCTEGVWPVAHCIPKGCGCFDSIWTGPQFATTIHLVKLHSLTTNQLKALPHIFDVGDVLWMLGQTKTSKRCENRKASNDSQSYFILHFPNFQNSNEFHIVLWSFNRCSKSLAVHDSEIAAGPKDFT